MLGLGSFKKDVLMDDDARGPHEKPPYMGDDVAASIAWVDGDVVDAADATVPLTDDGFLRGDAVFESVLVRDGRTHALAGHLARMRRSADAIDLALPDLTGVVEDLLAAWNGSDGAMKLIVTRGGAVRGMMLEPSRWSDTIGLAVIEVPWRTAISGVKTLSYAVNQWTKREALKRGGDDALISDSGVVHELSTGTLVAVHDGSLSSPDADRLPILDSITLEELRRLVDVAPALLSVDDIATADELFVLSATRPVIGVDRLVLGDGSTVQFDAPGPCTVDAKRRLADWIHASLDGQGEGTGDIV